MLSKRDLEFWGMVFNLKDSITPHMTVRVLTFGLASLISVAFLNYFNPHEMAHNFIQYSGVVMGIMIVFRLNAGHQRWWEAREIWGGLVNQCRNLSLMISAHVNENEIDREKAIDIVSVFPSLSLSILRGEKSNLMVEQVLGKKRMSSLFSSPHPAMELIRPLYDIMSYSKLNSAVYLKMLEKTNDLIDSIGKSERILKTPLPLVASIKIRRFLSLYLLSIPFGLYETLGWYTPLFTIFLAYPLLSLDQLARELENPFDPDRIAHLPLDSIAEMIKTQVKESGRLSVSVPNRSNTELQKQSIVMNSEKIVHTA